FRLIFNFYRLYGTYSRAAALFHGIWIDFQKAAFLIQSPLLLFLINTELMSSQDPTQKDSLFSAPIANLGDWQFD
ncbi:hypothetical protein CGH97_25805, partial [Vibrio parahaemolyticus]|uniref:hypothetical protein n=1 Tax=Vibrio parahaemolyticus TaxID=670 RepID=UPI0011693A75